MSEQAKKPWGFGLMGGNKGAKSIMVFILILIISVLVRIGGGVSVSWNESAQAAKERPSLALKSFLRDLREFMKTEKRMPENLRELEVKIWNKSDPGQPSRLQYGDQIMVNENYEYIYYTGKVGGVAVANVWAIPMGKHRDEFETVLLVIAANGEDIWRGPALNEQQRDFVFKKGFNPSFPEMTSLNMSKDVVKPASAPKERGRFGLL